MTIWEPIHNVLIPMLVFYYAIWRFVDGPIEKQEHQLRQQQYMRELAKRASERKSVV